MNKIYDNDKLKKTIVPIVYIGLFIAFFVYYFNINPMLVYDSDDWTYIGFRRSLLPDMNEWNPARILPEILCPLVGKLAAFVYLKNGADFFISIAFISAVIMTLLWTLYVFMIYKVMYNVVRINWVSSLLLSILFLLMHLVIFKSNPDSVFLYNAGSVTCTYYYSIPGLLCAVMVLMLMAWPEMRGGKIKWYKIAFVAFSYFAVFSNMLVNIILTSYAFVALCFYGYETIKANSRMSMTYRIFLAIYENFVLVIIEVLFAIDLYFDYHGGRAASFSDASAGGLKIGETLSLFFALFSKMNKLFIGIFVLVFVTIFVNIVKNKDSIIDDVKKTSIKLVISLGIVFIYMILLCSKVAPFYIESQTNVVTIYFYILLLIFINFGSATSTNKNVSTIVISALTFILLIPLLNHTNHFKWNNTINNEPNNVLAYENYIFNEILDKGNNSRIENYTLNVPDIGGQDWPFAWYGGARISNTLNNLGLMNRQLNIEVKWDSEINERFGLDAK